MSANHDRDVDYYHGYLAGIARAWRRGNVTWGHVAGAVRFARRRGLSDEQISATLRAFDIDWNPGSDTLTPHSSLPATTPRRPPTADPAGKLEA